MREIGIMTYTIYPVNLQSDKNICSISRMSRGMNQKNDDYERRKLL